MKIYNTRTQQTEELRPYDNTVRMYSCGPTVYDRIHIGNLSAFTYADVLRRTLILSGINVRHVMNITDIDDKTIKRSQEAYPSDPPEKALTKLTEKYTASFYEDMQLIGNDTSQDIEFIRATDSIEGMRQLINELYEEQIAYISDDGVYFSIDAYRRLGKKYGQLSKISEANTSYARIQNDEYDKDDVHDFALWKKAKNNEPAWPFEIAHQDLRGRPGWHIECSVMSVQKLGQPFDIHTGGIDLIFPHHENEIAQSTALGSDIYSNIFFHNEHLLVDGKKMSKSLNNFYTLDDIINNNHEPMAFRLLVLQSHYRKQAHFSWKNLSAAQNRLRGYERMADLKWQAIDIAQGCGSSDFKKWEDLLLKHLINDLNTPEALSILSEAQDLLETSLVCSNETDNFQNFLNTIESSLGIQIANRPDISESQKELIQEREAARLSKDWQTSDKLRSLLSEEGLGLRDTNHGSIWFRI